MYSTADRYHRRSARLPGYDYASAGAYFVTIITHSRESLFGAITEEQMVLSECGHIAATEWERAADVRPNVPLANLNR